MNCLGTHVLGCDGYSKSFLFLIDRMFPCLVGLACSVNTAGSRLLAHSPSLAIYHYVPYLGFSVNRWGAVVRSHRVL